MDCEMCYEEATMLVDRIWNDGDETDYDVPCCEAHGKSDFDGLWEMINVRRLEDE